MVPEVRMVRLALRVVVLASVVALFGAVDGASRTGPGLDALEKQKGIFTRTLVHPEADFSRYEKLLPTTVVLEFRQDSRPEIGDVTGSLTRGRSGDDERPNQPDRDAFKRVVWQAVAAELDRSASFEVVQDGSKDTLLVQVAVIDIDSNIPPEPPGPNDNPRPVRAQAVIVFDLVDAETGVLLARFSERTRSRRGGGSDLPSEIDGRWERVYTMAEAAATDLGTELERLRVGT